METEFASKLSKESVASISLSFPMHNYVTYLMDYVNAARELRVWRVNRRFITDLQTRKYADEFNICRYKHTLNMLKLDAASHLDLLAKHDSTFALRNLKIVVPKVAINGTSMGNLVLEIPTMHTRPGRNFPITGAHVEIAYSKAYCIDTPLRLSDLSHVIYGQMC